ncbi:MAG TPA: CHAT domain-containing tetratricopeptide repeat protein [Cyclobacteriaceae bacterium]|nr:CHAT domain-containing tetratricopeptide repeat protein [Cyclobacteriaceae bacterium]
MRAVHYIFVFFLLITSAAFAQDDEALIDSSPGHEIESAQEILHENKEAEALIQLGKFEDARMLLQSTGSKAEKSKFLTAITQTTSGLLYLNQGRNDLALDELQNAMNNFQTVGKSESLEAAQALAHLGNLYRATGKYAQAEEQLMMALDQRQKMLDEKNELIAATYNDLGLVFSMTDADKSLDYYEKALAIYKEIHGMDHPKIAIANTNIGFVYGQLELYGDAILNFESALAIWEKVYPQQAHPSKAFSLFNLGETYSKIGDTKAAAGYYERARQMYEASYGKKHPELSRVLNAIGSLTFASRNYDGALQHYQRALIANVSDFDNPDIRSNPTLLNFYDGNVLLYSMMLKAQALEGRYYGRSLKFSDLSLALETLHRCDSLIDKLRQQITNESDKIALGVIANEVYADGVRISAEAAKVAFKKRPYFELAFYFAEKSKAAVLIEAIADADAKSYSGIPSALLEEEKSLKAAIALCNQKLAQKPSADEEKYLRETSFTLNRTYETFVKKLETQFPDYFNLKFNTAAPSIVQLQSKLTVGTGMLSYFIDDKNNRLYIFQITPSRFKITERALPNDFDRLIKGFRNSLFFDDLKTYASTGRALSLLLLPGKIPASINDLVIIPTGRISIIPFEALLTDEFKSEAPYPSLPYLVKKYSVRYNFAAELILQKSQSKKVASPSILLCAPVTFPEKDNLDDLPGTETEVKGIDQLFASKTFNSDVYVRKQADEKLIKSEGIKNYTYIHFATHGVVDETSPELSRIFLQSDEDSEDGNLFAGEMYNLQLNANLVALSACQTGLGKISKGEGVIGLSRALVYAGARNIIVSFWSVADLSTSELMKDFYKEALDHPSSGFGENLRAAKIKMINSTNYAAPYYWAPFILIGAD